MILTVTLAKDLQRPVSPGSSLISRFLTGQHILVPRYDLFIADLRRLSTLINHYSIRVHHSICRHRRVSRWMFERHAGGELAAEGAWKVNAASIRLGNFNGGKPSIPV